MDMDRILKQQAESYVEKAAATGGVLYNYYDLACNLGTLQVL
jgi:hypothetical protein